MTWKELGIGLLIFTLLTMAAFGLSSAVWAQTETVTVSIPPQDLSTALKDFAEQTHLQVLYASKLTEGKITKGLSGTMPAEDAIRALLADTGLSHTFTDGTTIVIQQAAVPSHSADHSVSSESESTDTKLKLPEVTITATRSERPLAAIPEAVTVITQEEIEKQTTLSRSLVDVLGKLVPGFALGTQSLSNFGQTLRGRNALVMIDGVPQSTVRNAGRDLNTIDPSAIERIEIVRGATAIYGDGATGGIVHIITKRPGTGKPVLSTEVLASTAPTNPTAGLGGRIVQSIAAKKGPVDFSLSGFYERVGGLFDARGDRIPPDLQSSQGGLSDLNMYNLFGMVGADLGAQRLELTVNRFVAQQDSDYVTDFANSSQAGKAVSRKGLALDDQSGTQNTVVNLDYIRKDLFGSHVRAQAYYRDYLTRFFPFDGQSFATLGNNIIQSRVLSEKFGGRLTVETPLPIAQKLKPVLLWGADVSQEQTSQRVAIMDPATFANSGGLVFQPIDDRVWVPQMTQRSLAFFGQLELKLHERWLVRGGVRHERIGLETDAFTTLAGQPIDAGSRDFDATVFNAGTVVYLTDEVNLFANYSQGFSIPDVGLIIRSAPAGFSFSDSQLSPIRVNHYEVGIRGDWSSLQTSIVGYYTESLLGVTSAGFFANVVRAPERIYGVEGTLDVQLDRWSVGGTATYVEGENDINRTGDYKYLNGFRIPPLKLTAYLEHLTVPKWNWRNRLQVVYSGTRDPGLGPAVFGGRPVHSFTVLDFISTIKLGPGRIKFGIENLLNSQYYLPVSQLQRVGIASLTAARGMVVSLGYSVTW